MLPRQAGQDFRCFYVLELLCHRWQWLGLNRDKKLKLFRAPSFGPILTKPGQIDRCFAELGQNWAELAKFRPV